MPVTIIAKTIKSWMKEFIVSILQRILVLLLQMSYETTAMSNMIFILIIIKCWIPISTPWLSLSFSLQCEMISL